MANGFYSISEPRHVTLQFPDQHAPVQVDADAAPLVLASQRGDTDAFGQLYRRYARMVHGILLARVPRPDVEDLVHEVFLRALPRLQGLREASRFGAWLAAITRNMAKDYYRQPRVQMECGDNFAAQDCGPAPDDRREAAEVLECIRGLPEAYRETLILRLVEGMTGPEIAVKTGLSPGSVRVNLHRGMQQLREKLCGLAAPATQSKRS